MKLEHDRNDATIPGETAERPALRPSGRLAWMAALVGCAAGLGGAVGAGARTRASTARGGQGSGGKVVELVGAADQALTAAPTCIVLQRGVSGTVEDA